MSVKVAYKFLSIMSNCPGTICASDRFVLKGLNSNVEILAMPDSTERKSNLKMEGEGSREGSRRFQEAQHAFAETGDVEGKAKDAARALDGDEAKDLEKARKASAKGKTAV